MKQFKYPEIWDFKKRLSKRIIGIDEGEETQIKGTEKYFNKIVGENFPNLRKAISIKV